MNDTNNVPSKEQFSLATNLMKKLFSIDVHEDNIKVIDNDILIQSEKPDGNRKITWRHFEKFSEWAWFKIWFQQIEAGVYIIQKHDTLNS